jgi:hypothetical protein
MEIANGDYSKIGDMQAYLHRLGRHGGKDRTLPYAVSFGDNADGMTS